MFKKIFLLLLSVLFLSSVFNNIQVTSNQDIAANCFPEINHPGFVKIGNNYYLVESQQKAIWFKAAHICRSYNAHLAVIENATEMEALNDYLLSKNFKKLSFWLSGNDLVKEGSFKWLSTGQAMTFTKWSPGEPDNAGGNENCVHLWFRAGSFRWNDWGCRERANYICQLLE